MKTTKRILGILLALCLSFSLTTTAFASSFTDAHGNVIELDDTLEAYSTVALSGADKRPESRRPTLATCGPMRSAGLRFPGRSTITLKRMMSRLVIIRLPSTQITLLPFGMAAICVRTSRPANLALRSWRPYFLTLTRRLLST